MEFRQIAAAGLLAVLAQGCYRPMYAPPYGYSSQGYPMGGGYPGPINTTVPGQPYIPGSSIPPGGTLPGTGGVPTYNNAPTYSPSTGGPSATKPVPTYGDANPSANNFQQPDTAGGRELGFAPPAGGLMQTAGTAPSLEPNPFGGSPTAIPLTAEPLPTPAPVQTSDNFPAGGAAPTFQ